LFSFAIFKVVPLPQKQSKRISPSLLHVKIWSSASCSGNIAGCSKANLSLVAPPTEIG